MIYGIEKGNYLFVVTVGVQEMLSTLQTISFLEPATSPTGIDVEALPANAAVLTCLVNDLGYEDIFSYS